MNAFAMAFETAKKKDVGAVIKMDEWEAKSLGISLEKLHMWKTGYEETYKVVTETFELGYRMPNRPRSGWKSCGNY